MRLKKTEPNEIPGIDQWVFLKAKGVVPNTSKFMSIQRSG